MGMGLTPAAIASRTLYIYVNRGIAGDLPAGGRPPGPEDVKASTLYLYRNHAKWGNEPIGGRTLDQRDIRSRTLYAYVNRAHDRDPTDVAARALYLYNTYTDGELFPWIEKIAPTEALPGAQISIYGDGFGADQAAEGSVVRLGSPVDPTQLGPGAALGVVSWQTRSPGLWPANGGIPTEPAIVATLPDSAESGMITVEETT